LIVLFPLMQSCDTEELHDLDIPKVSIDDTKLNPAELFSNAQIQLDVSGAPVTQTYLHGYLQYYGSSSIVMPGDDYQYEIDQNYGTGAPTAWKGIRMLSIRFPYGSRPGWVTRRRSSRHSPGPIRHW